MKCWGSEVEESGEDNVEDVETTGIKDEFTGLKVRTLSHSDSDGREEVSEFHPEEEDSLTSKGTSQGKPGYPSHHILLIQAARGVWKSGGGQCPGKKIPKGLTHQELHRDNPGGWTSHAGV